MKPIRIPLPGALCLGALCLLAASALADEVTHSARPIDQAAVASPAAAPATAQRTATPGARVPAPAVVKPLSTEERALLDIQEDGGRQVAELAKSMQGLQDGPALRALQKKVEQIKQDTYVRFLQARATFARARGDLRAAQEAEAIVDLILHPRPIDPATVARTDPKPAQR